MKSHSAGMTVWGNVTLSWENVMFPNALEHHISSVTLSRRTIPNGT
jgi:hypothetical protein